MKKLLYIGVAVIFASAMFVTQETAAKADKVDICHIIAANDTVSFGPAPVTLFFGKVISIKESAVAAHLAHGDNEFFFQNDFSVNAFREAGVHLPAANCWHGVLPDGSTIPLM